jgi:pimeloyl-ACP methyl ester carboxylesterase
VTKDGYILNMFRIKGENIESGAPAVFLQHGFTDSADTWIMNYGDVAPAFQLARAGYDVWLGNQRGTKYSMDHTNLNHASDAAYWRFSFPEMGLYDAPAQVDYVRKVSGRDKITYIGHSQGTTQMFFAISRDEAFWKKRLNLFVAIAPVTKLDH